MIVNLDEAISTGSDLLIEATTATGFATPSIKVTNKTRLWSEETYGQGSCWVEWPIGGPDLTTVTNAKWLAMANGHLLMEGTMAQNWLLVNTGHKQLHALDHWQDDWAHYGLKWTSLFQLFVLHCYLAGSNGEYSWRSDILLWNDLMNSFMECTLVFMI